MIHGVSGIQILTSKQSKWHYGQSYELQVTRPNSFRTSNEWMNEWMNETFIYLKSTTFINDKCHLFNGYNDMLKCKNTSNAMK